MRRWGVVGQFAFRSLAFVVIMALALGLSITVAVRGLFISEAAKTGSVAANTIVLHTVRDVDLEVDRLDPALVRELDRIAGQDLAAAGVTTIKLWNTQGRLLYSSDGQRLGDSFATHESFLTAAAGNTDVEISREAREENSVQIARDGSVIEVYAPLVDAGRIIGVFEIYQPYAPVAEAVNRFLVLMWGIILVGSVPAYFLQLTLVKRTADELKAAKDDLAEVDARLRSSLEDIELHSLGTLQALVAAVDAKDSYTARHSIAVTDYAMAIGRRMELGDGLLRDLERAGLLHDIGKIGTPENVLLKPERLSSEEFEIISNHSAVGGHIVESVPFLSDLMPVIRAHHERWDGKGYPDGLMGARIPLLARILMVADAFDAMTSERPYRKPVSVEVARAELVRCAGTQFDPEVVSALLGALDSGEARVVIHTEAVRARRQKMAATA